MTTDSPVIDSLTTEDLPDLRPEDLVKQWYSYIDSNNFDLARLVSQGKMLSMISDMESDFKEIRKMDPSSPIEHFQTKFISINCRPDGAFTICDCLTEVDNIRQNRSFKLMREQEHWKMEAEVEYQNKEKDNTPSTATEPAYDGIIENKPTKKK